jgi:inositol transporter-like SP family MFS transporter
MESVRGALPPTGRVDQRRLRRTVVAAGLASYLDAAALVTVAIALPVWRQHYGLAVWQVGLLTSGLSCAVAVGAVLGGRLADRLGRDRVFTLDLLLFLAGAALVAAADGPAALLLGVTVLGLAVGADLPSSLGIVAAAGAPASRGRLVASTQLFWTAGVMGTFALGFAVSGLGPAGAQLLVGHLLLVGAFTVALRLTVRADLASAHLGRGAPPAGSALGGPAMPLLVTGGFFLCWQLAATTIGTYGTYYLVTHTGLTQTQATAAVVFTVPPVLMAIAFTRLADTVWRDRLFVVASGLQIIALATGALTGGDLVLGMVVLLLLWSVSNVFAGEAVYRVWSHLLLPADSRATAFGITYGVARIASAAFLLVVPFLIDRDPGGLLWVLTAFVALSGVAGLVLIHHPRLIPALTNGNQPSE